MALQLDDVNPSSPNDEAVDLVDRPVVTDELDVCPPADTAR